jgi:hypothetical protein
MTHPGWGSVVNYESRSRAFVSNVLACTHSIEPRKVIVPKLPPPPVPQKLCEMLKDYPEHIERLQEVLNPFSKPKIRLMPFDEAIWALEGRLETFIHEASEELKAAEATGDVQLIARAEAKERLMFRAASKNGGMRDLNTLILYFDTHKKAF